MKRRISEMVKRTLALLLCMAMMMNGGISALASENSGASEAQATEVQADDSADEEAAKAAEEEAKKAEEEAARLAEEEARKAAEEEAARLAEEEAARKAAEEEAARLAEEEARKAAEEEAARLAAEEAASKATEGDQNPVEGEQKPEEGEQKPAEGDQKPEEGEQEPVEGDQKPEEGEQEPVEGEQKPEEGEQEPVEGEQKPEEDQKPVEETISTPCETCGGIKGTEIPEGSIACTCIVEEKTPCACEGCTEPETCECTACEDETAECTCTKEESVVHDLEETLGTTTVTLNGSAEAFEEGKSYKLHVENLTEEEIAVVEAALAEMAKANDKVVNGYQAYDITLTADDEAAQPLANVDVTFAGTEIEALLGNEGSEIKAFHMNEGMAEEVSSAAGEKDVTITTGHFSTYVVASFKDAEPVLLETVVDGTKITLFGPPSSFDSAITYAIEATAVVAEEEVAAIEETLTEVALEKEAVVESYQAFDIKLFSVKEDGTKEEVQPLGPVQVTFSGTEVKEAVENEATEVSVLHVNTTTEAVEDMNASTTEESDVAIETTHFSVYVLVNLECMVGTINVTIKHMGDKIVSVDGTSDPFVKDSAKGIGYVRNTEQDVEIYAQDTIQIPNQYYSNIEALSKVCNINSDITKNYKITGVTIKQKDKSDKDVTKTFNLDKNGNLQDPDDPGRNFKDNPFNITNDAEIVFKYQQLSKDASKNKFNVTFFDYDVVDGSKDESGKWYSDSRGINASISNDPSRGSSSIWGIGQNYSGNTSYWATLNNGHKLNGYFLNQLPSASPRVDVLTGIVKNTLANGELQFNVQTPNNLFTGTGGSHRYDNYKLAFSQLGDTYTLEKVYRNNSVVLDNLSIFQNYLDWKESPTIYSNNFWPLDSEKNLEPHMGATSGQQYFRNASGSNVIGNGVGDDRTDNHNWHFGMVYEYTFEVGEYTGPMSFYFRGDDDFWLFIDGQLMVDIGGIHSAEGRYIDLRAAMKSKGLLSYDKRGAETNPQTHSMKVFYFERGGSGSNCYMQFTLPKVTPVDIPQPEFTTYTVNKAWVDNDNGYRPEEVEVQLMVQTAGEEASAPCDLPEHDHGHKVTLSRANNWTHTWSNLPIKDGTGKAYIYSVREIKNAESKADDGYVPSISGSTLTNTLTEDYKTKVKVQKVWKDADMTYFRPSEITMKLYANGNPYLDIQGREWTVKLNAANNWTADFRNPYAAADDVNAYDLPKYDRSGNPVTYTAKELDSNGNPLEKGGLLNGSNGSLYQLIDYTIDNKPEDTAYAAIIKATNEIQYGQLKIKKNLLTHNNTFGPATFVFRVDQVVNDGTKDIINTSEVISLVFDEAGVKEYTWPEKFVAGTQVTVTEVYSGASYKLTTDENVTKTIVADCVVEAGEGEIAVAEFTNTYEDGRLNGGTSALNVFSSANGWDGERFADANDQRYAELLEKLETLKTTASENNAVAQNPSTASDEKNDGEGNNEGDTTNEGN